MGYSGRILVAHPGVDGDVDTILEAAGFGGIVARDHGWIEAQGEGRSGDAPDVGELGANLNGPVLIAEVTTSDYAYCLVRSASVEPTAVILTPRALRAAGTQLPARAELEASYVALSEWSKDAPTPIEPAAVKALVRRGAVLAEDIVWELLSALGIAPMPDQTAVRTANADVLRDLALDGLGGYRRPTATMIAPAPEGARTRDWRTERFIMGRGDDFLGVWDRERPEAPVYRFEPTARGYDRALHVWSGMRARLELGEDDDRFEGLVGIEVGGFFPGGRWLAPRDWRFIPGWGDGFSAVWDREGGTTPVVVFKGGGDRTLWRAIAWALDATLPILAQRTVLGPDRWVGPHAPPNPYSTPGYDEATVFLVAREDADPIWPVDFPDGLDAEGYLLHAITKWPSGFNIMAVPERATADPERLMDRARKWSSRGDWVRVPDTVPRTLWDTAEWAIEASPFAATLRPFKVPRRY